MELLNALQMVLEFLGAGAKTATGYGRFEVNRQHGRLLQTWRAQYGQQQSLDQTAIQRSKMSLEQVFRDQLIHPHYACLVNHKEQAAETQDFAVIDYQNQAIKPVHISIIGTDNSAWYAFLSRKNDVQI